MPASYEGGLRLVEHYAGRSSTNKQTRGVFPHLSAPPSLNAGRVIRNRGNIMTGVAAQDSASVTSHGTRPDNQSFKMKAIPEDMLLVLMAFFHNYAYTNTVPVSANRETGVFKYGMIDAKPDHDGAVVGTYDSAAASYNALVAMSDVYSICLEQLLGHGNLGDVDNGLKIDNFVANKLTFEVQRGTDQDLEVTVEGFGRQGDELFDIVEASWGPGINGLLSSQSIITPDKLSLVALSVNAVDKISVYDDFFDSLKIEMMSGIGPRDSLGFDEYNSLATSGRPSVKATMKFAHVASDFLQALKNNYTVALTAKFANSANEYFQLKLPLLKVAESFNPNVGDVGSDVEIEVPLVGLVDTTVTVPLVEAELKCEFDVRTNSYYSSPTLALIP